MSFSIILADPPWEFDNKGNRFSPDYKAHYKTTQNDRIAALGPKLQPMIADNAILFLWCPNALVYEGVAAQCTAAWGFKPAQLIPWVKTSSKGTPVFGGGNYTRVCTEMLCLATRGRAAPLIKNKGVAGIVESFIAQALENFDKGQFLYEAPALYAPRGEHSAKPDESYQLIERLVDGPYLELFGRRKFSDKWVVVGDQSPDIQETLL